MKATRGLGVVVALAAVAAVGAEVNDGDAGEHGVGGSQVSESEMVAPNTLRAESFPARAADALSGSEFAEHTLDMPIDQREVEVLAQVRRGNIPEFLRNLKPVTIDADAGDRVEKSITLMVSADYLAIGTDEDFLRIPLGLATAATIALEFGFTLPTTEIVDLIYGRSALRLEPQPMTPGAEMMSMDYIRRHQEMVEEQRDGRMSGELTAGHKKDVVLTSRLREKTDRVAIYGWHQLDGEPIQPLSTVHVDWYADYSHGVRLVHQTVWVDGQPQSIFEALQDSALAPLLSSEGVIGDARELLTRVAAQKEEP